MKPEIVAPGEIEARSFAILTELLGDRKLDPRYNFITKRVIHTTADFDYADTLFYSDGVVEAFQTAIRAGADIITDTQMARAGIHKAALTPYGGEVRCFISDPDVAEEAKKRGITRSAVCMEKAASLDKPLIFALGNAPTALLRLCELAEEGKIHPAVVIGVPVGFVNVVESKEVLLDSGLMQITARGRKGGSNVAAAICNALLYHMNGRTV